MVDNTVKFNATSGRYVARSGLLKIPGVKLTELTKIKEVMKLKNGLSRRVTHVLIVPVLAEDTKQKLELTIKVDDVEYSLNYLQIGKLSFKRVKGEKFAREYFKCDCQNCSEARIYGNKLGLCCCIRCHGGVGDTCW